MLAQSLVEYAMLSTIGATIQRGTSSVEFWLASLTPRDWAIAGAVVVLGLALRSRRVR